uniref:Beta-glucosidase n=1 Tax=Kwoniella bestiolae CBS 10118 TaxID=1296100 RepID=A0A1B9GBW4_9TREE|nr:hypothetical protein I302_03360 [Kwoniella bestiolae CBS 10118]OCF28501.1 hypothetical protein I302_03360 [Kwoniella bestiolae CBS 10118]
MVNSKAHLILQDPAFQGVLPRDFAFGSATASYQIEGAIDADGKGPCVWDDCLREQDNGHVACDSYNQWKEDLKLLKQYGCRVYRFSIAWSRVKSLGGRNDSVNEQGIKYYSDMIDDLLNAGIVPWVTIFHWDHPLALEKSYGGFFNDTDLVEDFVSYAKLCFDRFGDRVQNWITINEPHIFTMQSSSSYKQPQWVHKQDHGRFARSLLLCHARAVELYRREFKQRQNGRIGIVYNCDWVEPVNDSPEAKSAADFAREWVLGFYADPVFLGRFPQSVVDYLGDSLPAFSDEEWRLIKGSTEFFGWNHYGTQYASGKRLETDNPRLVSFGSIERVFEKDGVVIGNKGEAGHPYDVPWGFRKLLRYIHDRYTGPASIPIFITECGFSIDGEADMTFEERIHDTQRQDYFAGYLKELLEAVRDDKIDCRGFMAWSLMDNLEWLYGYRKRFGITAVDMENGCKRTPKDSAALLKEIFDYSIAQ